MLFVLLFFTGAFAQEAEVNAKITDLEKVTTRVENLTTSSSMKPDEFPVFQNGTQMTMHFSDLYMILVRHDLKASDPNLYMCVELVTPDDQSTLCEVAKYMRFSGETESGSFSIKVKEINAIEIVRKGY